MTPILLSLLSLVFVFLLSNNAYAQETSWNIFLSPYEGISKTELFSPLELPVSSGDKVTWINQDSTSHKVVSGVPQHPDYSGEFFASDVIGPGESSDVYLNFEGFAAYYYFCEIHPWYTGKIFFEDNPNMYQSTLEISSKLQNNELLVNGLVESDLGSTGYEVVIFDSHNNLIYQKLDSFKPDASFDLSVDISNSNWDESEDYTLKLVYGVPSESTHLPLKISNISLDNELKSKSLELCQDSQLDSSFYFEEVHIPNWYKQSLCWFSDGFVTTKELSDSVKFFKHNFSQH